MKRREFLAATSAASLLPHFAWAQDAPQDIRITRIVGFSVMSRRSKVAGKNSRLDVHGDTATDRMVRIFTNTGQEGIGNCRASRADASELLGKNPFDYFDADQPGVISPLGTGSMPLWDLVGRVMNKPVYELLGGKGPKRVPVYDGSIYFADLLSQYADNWEYRFREEIDMARDAGHVAVKVKIGRGNKWMMREEGDARDAAIIKLIREHAGPDFLIGVDANNGYDLAGTKKLFEQIGDEKIAFAEEMFPEEVDHCLEFKAFLKSNGWDTLVADGETQKDLGAYLPFMKAGAIDVYQGDMNRFGFEGILTEASWAAEHGGRVAPHNWGSQVGFFMQVQIGRAITNFYRAENDPLRNQIVVTDGYKIENGTAAPPDAPGCGMTVDEAKFGNNVRMSFDLQA